MKTNNFQLTESQTNGLTVLNSDNNCFLTGHSGTGKTYLMNKWLNDNKHLKINITASTGMAAILINGKTFHSFFGLGLGEGDSFKLLSKALKNSKVKRNIKNTDVLLIEEVSMLSGYLLTVAESVCKIVKGSEKPWGGIKIIAIGDFAQLPPITKGSNSTFDWCFNSDVWRESEFTNILLKEPVRTANKEFLDILDKIRYGKKCPSILKFMKEREISEEDSYDFEGTRLYPFVAKAEEYNKRKLNDIDKELITLPTKFKAVRNDPNLLAQIKKNIPIPEVLEIKIGALVMLRTNEENGRWVNGTLAIVKKYDAKHKKLILRYLEYDLNFEVHQYTFEIKDDNEKVLASATNFPLILAYATSIHKSQGASIDRLLVDLHGVWEYGQAYVALSRTTNPDNMRIMNPNDKCIKAHPEVINLYEQMK